MSNCILWANVAPQVSGEADISYSNIQGGWEGEGNINVDPLFADPGCWEPNGVPEDPNDDCWVNGNYHLKSEAGRWEAAMRAWTVDDVTSPCIDAGNPGSDCTAELWPHGKRINIGAYGGTTEASMSLSDIGKVADLNHDDTVDTTDLQMLVDMWLAQDPSLVAGDIDRDGFVHFADFARFAMSWLAGVE
jgi:hypothetical protein